MILGHHQIGGYGVFNRLGELRPGPQDPIMLESKDHVVQRLEVIKVRNGISKSDPNALRSALQHPPVGADVAFVTCSGDVSSSLGSHADNTIVFARIVGAGHA